MITFDEMEKEYLKNDPKADEANRHNDINEWPCPLTDDMKEKMHKSYEIVKKDKK